MTHHSSLTYALEGSVFVGGAVVQWLRDGLGIIRSADEIEALARSVPDSGGVYLVPAFAGLGAPHWDQYARGTIVGITRGTTKAHLARAALEAIAFQVADLLDTMHADLPAMPIKELRVDGGAARNDLLLQFQADLLQRPVLRPTTTETTARGAALLAGLGVGVYNSLGDLRLRWKVEREFGPVMRGEEVAFRRGRWGAALARAREWEVAG
jgi:glycerol kinase